MSSLHDYYMTNYSKCPKTDNYLASWEGLAFTSHSFTMFLFPFHILGGYCILWKTPNYMTFYRWPLFNLHFWSCFVDILISALITPYLIFPAVAGFPVGILRVLGVPITVQIWLGVASIHIMIMSMTILFENRHNSIPSNRLRITRPSTKILYYSFRFLLLLLYSFAIFLFIPEQEPALLEILQSIPCPTEEYFTSPVFVLCIHDTYTNFLAAVTALGVLLECLQMLFFITCCLYYLFFSLNGFTSKKTRKLQIAYFSSILMQVSIPIVFLLPSFVFLVISVVFKYYNQALTNFSVLYASIHGFLSTVVVLAIHKPYRSFILSLFGKTSTVDFQRRSFDTRKASMFPTHVS